MLMNNLLGFMQIPGKEWVSDPSTPGVLKLAGGPAVTSGTSTTDELNPSTPDLCALNCFKYPLYLLDKSVRKSLNTV